ncbi:MAG: SO2930 family diheme c-type cytochrome [Cyclobacteriaceae bacterium]
MVSSFFFFVLISQLFRADQVEFDRKERLSDYGFFEGTLRDLNPSAGVFPYTLNTPLFSNYAEKLRFVKLPEGKKIRYRDSAAFDFPFGSVLIKNFYYPLDFRKPEMGRVILETRLLVHEENGWQAYPYIWNREQTEAIYDPAGEARAVRYVNASGKKISTSYLIPNKNQCKGCHLKGNVVVPVGPSARQLNRPTEGTAENQLKHWAALGIIEGLPPLSELPKGIVWDDAATGSLNDRARAYLDANCAHCHSKEGPANTSGLFLDVYEKDPSHLGVNKSPVAAGRGAGNLNFDIVPRAPDKSILIFRMKTNDLAIAMPEIGREQVHKEGVALVEEWIRKNTFSNH